jgi:hypothetical protein
VLFRAIKSILSVGRYFPDGLAQLNEPAHYNFITSSGVIRPSDDPGDGGGGDRPSLGCGGFAGFVALNFWIHRKEISYRCSGVTGRVRCDRLPGCILIPESACNCNGIVNNVIVEGITVGPRPGFKGASYKGVSYLCATCNALLSVASDPISIKADTLSEVVGTLRDEQAGRSGLIDFTDEVYLCQSVDL